MSFLTTLLTTIGLYYELKSKVALFGQTVTELTAVSQFFIIFSKTATKHSPQATGNQGAQHAQIRRPTV